MIHQAGYILDLLNKELILCDGINGYDRNPLLHHAFAQLGYAIEG